jgi:hypothetical protein
MKNKLALILLSSSIIASNASAYKISDNLKVDGSLEFRMIYNNQDFANANYAYKMTGAQNRQTFDTRGNASAEAKSNLNDDLSYGFNLTLLSSVSTDKMSTSYIFLTSKQFGEVEIGSGKTAVNQMRSTGYSVSAGSGGSWQDYILTSIADKARLGANYFFTMPEFLGSRTRSPAIIEFAEKFTYFSPEINGFSFGVTYVPDTLKTGQNGTFDANGAPNAVFMPVDSYHTIRVSPDLTALSSLNPSIVGLNDPKRIIDVKNGYSYGVQYEHDFTFAKSTMFVGGEKGKAVHNTLVANNKKIKDLSAYFASLDVEFETSLRVAGHYSNAGKSFSHPSDKQNNKNITYSVGAYYDLTEDVGISSTYFASSHRGNKYNAISFETGYYGIENLNPFLDITKFNTKGFYQDLVNGYTPEKNNGYVFLTGIRLSF